MLTELDKELLDKIITDIPEHKPFTLGKDATVHEMYPDLTNEELDYVMERYQGEMER